MDYQIIDNFLPLEQYEEIEKLFIFNGDFPFYFNSFVSRNSTKEKLESDNWNWYGTHVVYYHGPTSSHWDTISKAFFKSFNDLEVIRAVIRVKINFYPWTNQIYEHAMHTDHNFSHKAAVYSLNTCDGYTRMPNGDKVESVANRIVLFDGSKPHASSTTSNVKGRFNINFNWL